VSYLPFPDYEKGTEYAMNKSNFLPMAATVAALFAAQSTFAGEPTFGDPTVYGRLNITSGLLTYAG